MCHPKTFDHQPVARSGTPSHWSSFNPNPESRPGTITLTAARANQAGIFANADAFHLSQICGNMAQARAEIMVGIPAIIQPTVRPKKIKKRMFQRNRSISIMNTNRKYHSVFNPNTKRIGIVKIIRTPGVKYHPQKSSGSYLFCNSGLLPIRTESWRAHPITSPSNPC